MDADFTDRYCFFNSQMVETEELVANQLADISVYEVIKIVAGIPLFFDDHYKRLCQSQQLAKIPQEPVAKITLINQIKALCKANAKFFGNMELRLSWNGITQSSKLGFVPHKYPEPLDYMYGVTVALMKNERDNPNAKIKNSQTRVLANQRILEQMVFEVLLVNESQAITEGSRSNVFFIKNNQVYTAPGSMVLKGITRKYVLKSLELLQVSLHEQLVFANELNTFDAAFLCGTSPGVLPVKQIDEINFDVSHGLLRQIMKTFNDLAQDYLSSQA